MDQRTDLNVVEFLSDLAARDIKLWLDADAGDQLRYRARKDALTPKLIGVLKEHKSEIVAWLRESEAVRSGVRNCYPLSQGQLGLWLDWCMAPDSTRYHLFTLDRLPADFCVDTLRKAAQKMLDRHPVLRTVYREASRSGEEQPEQEVLASQTIEIPFVDGSDWTEAQINEWAKEIADRPFDLRMGPVMRMAVLRRVGEQGSVEHLLYWTVHHIATDYSTRRVLRQELAVFYDALRQGDTAPTEAPCSDAGLTFHDFVRWEEDVLRSKSDELSAFWQSYLSGSALGLELPMRSQQAVADTTGQVRSKRVSFAFSPELTGQLRLLARSQETTLYAVLLTAFEVLLHRYTQQDDLLIVSPASSRALPGWSNTVGYFVNPLLLRADLAGNAPFTELLQRTQKNYNRVLQHQAYPYPAVIRQLQKQIAVGQLSEAAVGFVLVSTRQPGQDDSLFEPVASEQRGMPQSLTLTIFENGDQLSGFITYNPDRFDDLVVERMGSHLQMLFAGASADPTQRIGALPLLSPDERRQILVDWNDTSRPYREDKCLHNLFEEQAARTPDATAVVFEGEYWTYSELNERANQIAHRLQNLGVGPDTLVGICVERSREMIAGLLGILKAGGAFVPLDPAYPKDRLAFMLEDAAVAVLLTEEHLQSNLPMDDLIRKPTVICVDSDRREIAEQRSDNPTLRTHSDNLAYVMYTSGSTGKPKGVMVEHRAVSNLAQAQMKIFDVTTIDRVLQFASISFDAALFEISVALCSGAALYVATAESLTPGLPLEQFLATNRISFLWLTPSVLAALDPGASERLTALRVVTVGGEICRSALVKTWSPGRRFVNLYGPTETTIYSTTAVCDASMEAPPIGVPVDNVQVYIVDHQGQPVPVGVAGELWIGGDCLARGYFKQPQLTEQRFIPNPFARGRVYRTGDLVRWLPNGNIELIRRMDEQVKIRGFRVELGEIEAVMSLHPAVREVAVLARVDEQGSHGLVAYVTGKTGTSHGVLPEASELRSFLQTKLPGYMVPGSFFFLDDLPLTSSGKLDRKALGALNLSPGPQSNSAAPPRTELEHALCNIWCAVLGLKQVGILDNFFELGGHSLSGAQVVSRIRQALAMDVPLRTLFEAPTIAALSATLAKKTATGTLSPIPRVNRSGRLPLSYAQERLWFLDQLNSERNIYNVPAVLRLRGHLDVAALERSLREISRRHESLRTTFPVVDGQPIQFIHAEALPVIRVSLKTLSAGQQRAEIDRLVRAEANHIFDLVRGPLIRVSLVELADEEAAEQEYLFIINLHHIVTDGWSMRVFSSDLAALYSAFTQGQPSPLNDLPFQYADFAVWQRTWVTNETIAEQLAYWKRQLSGAPPFLTLPTDRPRLAVQTHAGAHHFFEFPLALVRRLRSLSVESQTTLFVTLLAAFKVLLMRYSGQQDIVVGTPIANRNQQAIEPLIGFFVNSLALRSDLSGDLTFVDLLARVKDTTLDAYRGQDVPFGKVVEHLQPERNLSHSPLFNVVFDLSISPFRGLNLPGVVVENVAEIEFPISKFDLTVSVVEETSSKGEDRLGGHIEYKTDLFDLRTIEAMARHFQTLLEGIADNPRQSIHTLPLLAEAERAYLSSGGTSSGFEPIDGRCFHHLFEEQVARTPNATAVVFDPGQGSEITTLTYGELNRRANQLAHYLKALGVGGSMGAETLVGISVDRGPEMIVAILATLKAGGAYVPLDPAYPPERLAFMLADSQVPLILTEQRFVAALPPSEARFVCLDALALENQPAVNPNTPMTADHLAYIIYTSGSTGRPKGVLIEHRGLCNTSDAQVQAFGVRPKDRHLLFFSLSFDGCTADVILALRVGAALYLAPQQEIMPGEPLHRFLRKHSISTLIITPSSLAPVQGKDLPALRMVIVAGETCSAELVSRWSEGRRFLNLYGATESSIFSTVQICIDNGRTPSVGYPVCNNLLDILDSRLQPVPIGVPGEIYIGGAGVGRGYHNRPDLNEKRFLANPFAAGRMYKTGDLGRHRAVPDSEFCEIEFLGRIDNQVKLRGFRIELDEITAVLGQHPDVQDAVVTVHGQPGERELLVAYVVIKVQPSQRSDRSADLRSYLQAQLPDYMIPGTFVTLERLPLTVNGKVDRNALPAPITQTRYIAPQNAIERQIAAMWKTLLNVDAVGAHDNFFELGGHSLLVIQLQSQLQEMLQGPVAVTDLFRYPTVSSLATYVRKRKDSISGPARTAPRNRPLPRSRRSAELQVVSESKS